MITTVHEHYLLNMPITCSIPLSAEHNLSWDTAECSTSLVTLNNACVFIYFPKYLSTLTYDYVCSNPDEGNNAYMCIYLKIWHNQTWCTIWCDCYLVDRLRMTINTFFLGNFATLIWHLTSASKILNYETPLKYVHRTYVHTLETEKIGFNVWLTKM